MSKAQDSYPQLKEHILYFDCHEASTSGAKADAWLPSWLQACHSLPADLRVLSAPRITPVVRLMFACMCERKTWFMRCLGKGSHVPPACSCKGACAAAAPAAMGAVPISSIGTGAGCRSCL